MEASFVSKEGIQRGKVNKQMTQPFIASANRALTFAQHGDASLRKLGETVATNIAISIYTESIRSSCQQAPVSFSIVMVFLLQTVGDAEDIQLGQIISIFLQQVKIVFFFS